MSEFSYIAVAGNIASGKTTLVKKLSETHGLTPFYEANALNPYLTDFYDNMNQWAFHSQTFFLIQKFKIHQRIEKSEQTGLLDRTLYEDAEIFAKQLFMTGKMTRRDYNLYREFYIALKQALKPPKLMIYLKTPLETLQERIKLRGRPEEQNIPLEYLAGLQGLYEEWIHSYKDSDLKVIEPGCYTENSILVHPN
jgi:deoxyadenosine/deoxycytidine kinase